MQGRWILMGLLAAFLMIGWRGAAAADGTRLMIISDLHYLSPSCYEESDGLFQRAMTRSDGKMSHYSAELLQALKEEVLHVRPDALIVTGDLTFNGEEVSHQELAEIFGMLETEGIPIWVIPGNHDINNENARIFTGDSYRSTYGITTSEFGEIYREFLGDCQWEETQYSYVVPLREDLWLVMCDFSVYDPFIAAAGYYSTAHRAWLQRVLKDASEFGAKMITATHQSMIPHTLMLLDSMTIWGREEMVEDIRKQSICNLNLSGHLHLQHISEEDGIYDIATGSFAVPPFRYGLLEVGENGDFCYEAKALCSFHLPENVSEVAKTWFEDVTIGKTRKELEKLGIPEEQMEIMLEYAGRLNHAYFSGELNDRDASWMEEPAYARWEQIVDQYFFASYLTGIPADPLNQRDVLQLKVEMGEAAGR